MNQKAHLTSDGLNHIVSLRAKMNNGLSETLQISFPYIIPIERPLILIDNLPDPNWLSGFVDGEGNFYVKIIPNILKKTSFFRGYQIQLIFRFHQNIRDQALLTFFTSYLKCGYIEIYSTTNTVSFNVVNIHHLYTIIIPFFILHPLYSQKAKDFEDFKVIAQMMVNKEHLTNKGLDEIRKIKSGMNSGRLD